MKLSHFAISQQGDSHIISGKNCQDHSATARVKNQKKEIEMVIAAIADGVSACDYSEEGSRIAVTTVMDVLCKDLTSLEELNEDTVLPLIRKAFQQAKDNIECEADNSERPFLMFNTTLSVAVLTENGSCYIGHIGDGGIVALFTDGSYKMITSRMKGDTANSVIPLSVTEYWAFGVAQKPIAAIALMTDGLLDKSVGSARLKHRVYYPFFKPMFENVMETDADVSDLQIFWDDFLRDKDFRKQYGITDDITLAVVQIPSILNEVKPEPFNEEKWAMETEKVGREIEEALRKPASFQEEQDSIDEIVPSEKSLKEDDDQTEIESKPDDQNADGQDLKKNEKNERIISPELDYSSDVGMAVSCESVQKKKKATNESLKAKKKTTGKNRDIASEKERETPNFNSTKKTVDKKVVVNKNGNNKARVLHKKKRTSPLTILSLIVVVGLASVVIGYRIGIIHGKRQGQLNTQQEYEKKLKDEYQRGYEVGKEETQTETIGNLSTVGGSQDQLNPIEHSVISAGQKGDVVEFIQRKLNEKGWSLEQDGDYNTNTEKAICEFQEINQLPPTGNVDVLTFWMLIDEKSIGYKVNTQSDTEQLLKSENEDTPQETENQVFTTVDDSEKQNDPLPEYVMWQLVGVSMDQ